MSRSTRPFAWISLCVFASCAVMAVDAWATTSKKGPHRVTVSTGAWTDSARGREVPFKLYRPATIQNPVPVLVFSHGYGGSRDAAPYLGEHMASHGYVSFHIQHPGSDSSIWEGSATPLRTLAQTPITAEMTLNRLADLPFALNQIEAANAAGPLAGKLDLTAIGMWGHSFGGVSTMAAAGQRFRGGQMAEPRIRAAVVFSPNAPRGVEPEVAYAGITIPMLYVSGTEDVVRAFQQNVGDRRIAFEHSTSTTRYLYMNDGANHAAWSGTRRREPQANRRARKDVKALGLAFWQAYLEEDKRALSWLRGPASGKVKGEFLTLDPARAE